MDELTFGLRIPNLFAADLVVVDEEVLAIRGASVAATFGGVRGAALSTELVLSLRSRLTLSASLAPFPSIVNSAMLLEEKARLNLYFIPFFSFGVATEGAAVESESSSSVSPALEFTPLKVAGVEGLSRVGVPARLPTC